MLYERDPSIPRIGSDCQQLRIEAKSISTLVATASSRYRPVRQARVMNVLQHPSITYRVLEEEERKYSSTENTMWAIVFLLLYESSGNEINAHDYEIAVEGVGKLRRGGFCPAHLRAVPEIGV
jgi:hypothetical protein